MDINLLKQITNIQSISGNEDKIENFILNFAKTNNLKYEYSKGNGIIIGNKNAKFYCMAHIDEVGGIIKKSKNGEIKFKGIGWVNPDMFVGRDIEIRNDRDEIIEAIVVGNKPLKTSYKNFGNLKIITDIDDKEKISTGNYLRYKSVFIEKKNSIFANSLDNKIGVFALLEIIKNIKREVLNDIAFCFTTQEEIKNKGAIFF